MFLLLALLAAGAHASPDFPAPALNNNSLELKHTAISLSYNPRFKLADWVFYPLGARELRNCTSRKDSFRPDPTLPREDSAQLSDYIKSGYDRGHLAPAGDNKWSEQAMDESFLLSNVAPQSPGFNRGIWGTLENLVRAWALRMQGVWVATGPVLTRALPTIGRGLAVPDYFYKVIATQKGDRHEAIAILLPRNAEGDLRQYVKTVSELETITGLDFLSGLPDEREAESVVNPKAWNFSAKFNYLPCSASDPGQHQWAWGISPQ